MLSYMKCERNGGAGRGGEGRGPDRQESSSTSPSSSFVENKYFVFRLVASSESWHPVPFAEICRKNC